MQRCITVCPVVICKKPFHKIRQRTEAFTLQSCVLGSEKKNIYIIIWYVKNEDNSEDPKQKGGQISTFTTTPDDFQKSALNKALCS